MPRAKDLAAGAAYLPVLKPLSAFLLCPPNKRLYELGDKLLRIYLNSHVHIGFTSRLEAGINNRHTPCQSAVRLNIHV